MKNLIDPFYEYRGQLQIAVETAEVIKDQIAAINFKTLNEVTSKIKKIGKKIMKQRPLEFSVENIVKKIITTLKQLQEDLDKDSNTYKTKLKKITKISDLGIINQQVQKLDKEEDYKQSDLNLKENNLKLLYVQAIKELIDEMPLFIEKIQELAFVHINSYEYIGTYGSSNTVQQFMIDARKKRTFELILMQDEIQKTGEQAAKVFVQEGITTTLIPFSAAYAFMPRINKIFIGCHAIMKNGGILAKNGTLLLATAAKAYSVPVIVLASSIKLTPHFPFEQNTFNDLLNPKDVLKDEKDIPRHYSVVAARFDYITPELITLFITNCGEYTPAYIYRLFNEYYIRED